MGILDKFKKKKKQDLEKREKPSQGNVAKKEKKAEAVKTQSVVAPDGRLVNLPKKGNSKKTRKVKPKREETGNAYKVLIRPMITEKSSSLGMYNKYVFEVYPKANKIEVRKAIKKVYGISPLSINIMNVSGRQVRYGKTTGRTRARKKAIVTLKQGEKIDIQEGL